MLRSICLALLLSATIVTAQGVTESNDFSYPLKLYNQQFYDLAAQQFVKFYTNYPNSSKADQAHFFTAMSWLNLKAYDKARAEFQSLAVGYPKSEKAAEAWFRTGTCNLKLNDPAEAAKAFETIRLLYPKHALAPEGLYEAAKIYLDMTRYTLAYQNLSVIIDRYTASSFYGPALVKAALVLSLQDEPEQAVNYIDRVLKMDAEAEVLSEANLIAAKIELQRGNPLSAQNYLDKVLSEYAGTSSVGPATLLRAQLYMDEENYDQAEKLLLGELKSEQKQKARILLADNYFLANKYTQALEQYQALKIEPSASAYLKIQLKAALALRMQGNDRDARALLKKSLLAFNDRQDPVYSACDSIYQGWLESDNKVEESIARLNQVVSQLAPGPDRFKAQVRLASNLSKTGNWREVIHVLQPLTLAQERFSSKDEAFFYLARAYEQIEDFSESIYYYRKLLNDFPGSSHYDQAAERIEFLTRYKIVNTDQVLEKLADITAETINGSDVKKQQLNLGIVYLEELKNFKKAEKQFLTALRDSSALNADLHHFLGKTYLAQAELLDDATLKKQAAEQFKLALQNANLLSYADEASWLLVKMTINSDTSSIERQSRILQKLIQNYPQSRYLETWISNLAFRLSIDTTNYKQSVKYFNLLVEKYPDSKSYPHYLFGLAEAQAVVDRESAIAQYKRIAADFPYSHPAAKALFEVAAYYEQNEMYDEARQLYEMVMNKYYYTPQAEEVRYKIGPLLVRAGLYKKAVPYLESLMSHPFMDDAVLSKVLLPAEVVDMVYFYARTNAALNHDDTAISAYKKYLRKSGGGEFALASRFSLGELYYKHQKYQLASDQFRQIVNTASVQANRAALYLSQIEFDRGNYPQAAGYYKKVDDSTLDAVQKKEIFARYAISLIRAGNVKESKKAIAAYKKKFPDDKQNSARFIVELAEYQRLNKNYKKASQLLKQVLKKHRKSDYADDAEYSLALIHISQNRIEEAFKILSGFYNKYSNSNRLAAALNTLGNLYFRTEKYDNAITMFKNALKGKPDADLEANIKSNLIKTYTMTGFWDAAQALAREYVKQYPKRADLIDKKIIIAQAYINLNQFQNAVDYLKKIKLEADAEREPEIQFYIGEALLKGGQYENAIAEFVKIPLLSKKTKLQWEASALYYSGQSYEKLGRMNDAKRMYQEIIRRPGIDLILKKEAEKRIQQIQ